MSSREAGEERPYAGDDTGDGAVADVETSRSNLQLHVRLPSGGQQWIDHTVNMSAPPPGGHVRFEVAGQSVDYTVRTGSADESSGGGREGATANAEPRGDGHPTSEGETLRSAAKFTEVGGDGDSTRNTAKRGAPAEGGGGSALAVQRTSAAKSKKRRRIIEDSDEGEIVEPEFGAISDDNDVREGSIASRASKEKTDGSYAGVGEASPDESVINEGSNGGDVETAKGPPSRNEEMGIGELRDEKLSALSSSTSIQHYRGKCDVCRKKDHVFGHQLQKCADCGVLVHEACYGLLQSPDQSKLHGWLCWPCKWKDQQPDGERATVCVLCTEAGGTHALHPLYNKEGANGKQLVRRSGPAWVHTLCAMFLGSFRYTQGCVFACDIDGNYSMASSAPNEDDEGDSTAVNSASELHHFVICNASDPKHSEWYKKIKLYRSELRCSICKKKDSAGNVLRIPVQCCTNDDNESYLLKGCHPPNKVCATAMHVGCARWKNTETSHCRKTVYFWPGTTWQEQQEDLGDQAGDPIAEIYCIPCSQDVAKALVRPTQKTDIVDSGSSRKDNDQEGAHKLPETDTLPGNAGRMDNMRSGGGEALAATSCSRKEDDTSQKPPSQEQNAPMGNNAYAVLENKGKYQFRYSDGEYYSGRLVRSNSDAWVFECRGKGENFDIPMPKLEEEWHELLDTKIFLPGWKTEAGIGGTSTSNKGTRGGRNRGKRGLKGGDSKNVKKCSVAKRPVIHDAEDDDDSKSQPDKGNKRACINKHSNAQKSSLARETRDKELTILSKSGEETFHFSVGEPAAVTFSARLCTHRPQQKRIFDALLPPGIAYQGKLSVRQMNAFVSEKRSTKNSVIDILRLKCSTTGTYMEAYKTFYKAFEEADRIAMCCVEDNTKLFLVTPKFFSQVTCLANDKIERNNKSTYVVIVTPKKKKAKG